MENQSKSNKNNDEIIIENNYQVTKELFKKWAKENKKYKYFKIFWLVVTILCSASFIEGIINNHVEDTVYGILPAVYGLLMIIFGNNYFFVERNYKVLERFYKKNNW